MICTLIASLALEQSHTLVKPGETVTFTAHAAGVAGRDESIKWEAKGGDMRTANNMDRYAQVTYNRLGDFAVVASLYVDGNLVDREEAVVHVDPLT